MIFHLCSYYHGSKIYSMMFSALGEQGVKQNIFIPIRDSASRGKFQIDSPLLVYSWHIVTKPWHRILYYWKIKKWFRSFLDTHWNPTSRDVVHAHSLFSDGAVALEIKNKFGTPYVVTVRNTDINFFFRYALHLRKHGHKILTEANAVLFLGEVVANTFLSKLPPPLSLTLQHKVHIIPNGIDSFWLENEPLSSPNTTCENTILFVGQLDSNKNLLGLIKACELLRKKGRHIRLEVVGPTPPGIISEKISLASRSKPFIYCHGRVDNLIDLRSLYQKACVLAVPSHLESFGLVYAEALSQGVPVLYSKGQGFDGWVKDGKMGEGVNSRQPRDIALSLEKCLSYKEKFSRLCMQQSKLFCWKKICSDLITIYNSIGNIH